MKYMKIYKRSLALYLIEKNCTLLYTEDNFKHKGFKVFVFKRDNILKEALDCYNNGK